jgi:hypothetical protein
MNSVLSGKRRLLFLLCANVIVFHCSCYYYPFRSPLARSRLSHDKNNSRRAFFSLKIASKQNSSNQPPHRYTKFATQRKRSSFSGKALYNKLHTEVLKGCHTKAATSTTHLLCTKTNSNSLSNNFDDLSFKISRSESIIKNTIREKISEQNALRQQSNGYAHQTTHCYNILHSEFIGTAAAPPPETTNADDAVETSSIGLLGDSLSPSLPVTILPRTLSVGTPLIWQSGTTESIRDNLTVRVATTADDSAIASIRQIVFWHDPNNSLTKTEHSSFYHQRCCEMLEMRRRKEGAICLAAVLPATILSSSHISLEMAFEFDRHCTVNRYNEKEWIIGTVECSIHEFYGTQLGQCYGPSKLLYLTEVAVLPSARRSGTGMMLLQVNIYIYTHTSQISKPAERRLLLMIDFNFGFKY